MVECKSRREKRTNVSQTKTDFGVRDARGRAVGTKVTFFVDTFVALPADAKSWHNIKPGRHFGMVVSATRDGASFGASQPDRYFPTAVARLAARDKHLKDVRKRALKLAR